MSSLYEKIQTPYGMAEYRVNICDKCGKQWTDSSDSYISAIGLYKIFSPNNLFYHHGLEHLLQREGCSSQCFNVLAFDALMEITKAMEQKC